METPELSSDNLYEKKNTLQPKTVDFKKIRNDRQENNDKRAYNTLKNNETDNFSSNFNMKGLDKILNGITKEQFISKCKEDDTYCNLAAIHLSKKASRQGSKDEKTQIDTCNFVSEKCGIDIRNLSANALRPTKTGKIVNNKDMKREKIPKDSCLKSFDAKITGKMEGYISAKVSFGNGGHQDNVFEEMDNLADWWKKYKNNSDEFLIILIDTDLTKKVINLKQKYTNIKNIKIFNHVEFQQYIIDTYNTN